MQKDPDEQVARAIARVFERFDQVGTIHQTHLYLVEEGVEVPVRGANSQLVWRLPTYEQIRRMLSNPVYAGAYVYGRRQVEETARQDQEKLREKTKKPGSTQSVMELLHVEPMEVEIGYRLVPLLEPENGGDLLDRIAQIRRQTAAELGMVLPSVRVRDNLQLQPNQYNIKLRGVMIESGEVRTEMFLAMETDAVAGEPLKGIATKEPAFNLPATWIYPDQKEEAEMKGYTVVSPSAVMATHLSEVVKKYAPDILSRLDVQSLLDHLKKTAEPLVEDVIPEQLTMAELHVILQNLLRERVAIRDLGSILESLSYHSRVNKDKDYLTEQCRMALSRSICKQYQDPVSGDLMVLTLSPATEEEMANGISADGQLFSLSPVFTQALLKNINQEIERVLSTMGVQPVLLCNTKIRLPLRRLIERMLPQIGVLSYNEIGPTVKASAVGMIDPHTQAIPSG
jgi:flagellar biosynthesis protein FlhA